MRSAMSKPLTHYLDVIEYPSHEIEETGGIAQDTQYDYVSNSFLNGLINYGSGHQAVMINRYGLKKCHLAFGGMEIADGTLERLYPGNEELWKAIKSVPSQWEEVPSSRETREEFVRLLEKEIHSKLIGDDWWVFWETSSSFMFAWFDNDCSDCSIARHSAPRLKADLGIITINDFMDRLIPELQAQTGISEITSRITLNGWISG